MEPRLAPRLGHRTAILAQVLLLFALVLTACFRIWILAESHNSIRSVNPRRLLQSGGQCVDMDIRSQTSPCHFALKFCGAKRSIFNYVALHYCQLQGRVWVSVPLFLLAVICLFFALAKTAENFFSPVTSHMVEMLRMSPTMGGVTLLALGNGAPDVFTSMSSIGEGSSPIGLGAIVSAGTFVSAFVLGSVAVAAAPFPVKSIPFIRDVLFYTTAVAFLFILYLKGAVTLWQGMAMMLFYLLFVFVVIFMDQLKSKTLDTEELTDTGLRELEGVKESEIPVVDSRLESRAFSRQLLLNVISGDYVHLIQTAKIFFRECCHLVASHCSKRFKVKDLLEKPLEGLLKATIPEINPVKWSRFYSTLNVVFCPLIVLYMFGSMIMVTFDHKIRFLLPTTELPLWSLVLAQDILLGVTYFITNNEAPQSGQTFVVFMAFIMSVFWISFMAGELLGCLAALGVILGISPAVLGLTVLAWGNSIGDLVADVAIAKAGKPAMAIAGCFAGPMFNMLIGIGFAIVIWTADLGAPEYYLQYHPSIFVAFIFLFASLLGSLLVISCSKFQVTRLWGYCLIALYVLFTMASLAAARSAL